MQSSSREFLPRCTYTDGQAVLLAIVGEFDDELGASLLFTVVQRPETTDDFNTILRWHFPFRRSIRHVLVGFRPIPIALYSVATPRHCIIHCASNDSDPTQTQIKIETTKLIGHVSLELPPVGYYLLHGYTLPGHENSICLELWR